MCDKIRNNNIGVSIDETTDACARKVANVIVGVLGDVKSRECYLLTSAELSAANNVTIADLFHDAMQLLRPDNIQHDQVLLFVTDAVPYMVKAAGDLKKNVSENVVYYVCCTWSPSRY